MNGRGDVAEGISANGTIKPELAQNDETPVGNDKRQTSASGTAVKCGQFGDGSTKNNIGSGKDALETCDTQSSNSSNPFDLLDSPSHESGKDTR